MRLSIKDIKAGVTNCYEVQVTLHINHATADKAVHYLYSTMEDWAVNGKIIHDMNITSVRESSVRGFVAGVRYPEAEYAMLSNKGEQDDNVQ
jgi:hypothetical protein